MKTEVRIICRDLMKQESLEILIALGFPREVIRFQPACHSGPFGDRPLFGIIH